MPTNREREYYRMGYQDGLKDGKGVSASKYEDIYVSEYAVDTVKPRSRPKRKVSSWQKFVKANSNKKKFKYASGKLNLKKMGVAYRKTAAYKRNKKK
jgi:hypothetical protein